MLNYDVIKIWQFPTLRQSYSQRDSMLYALGLNFGANPLDERQLQYVYEKTLKTIPTMATVLGSPGFWWRDPNCGVNCVKIVHGEQRIRLFMSLPGDATVTCENRVLSITDKGTDKGTDLLVDFRSS